MVKTEASPNSYRDYYQRGLITKRELVRLSQPLIKFLEENGLNNPRSFPKIRDRFKDELGVIFIRNPSKMRRYYVDPDLAKARIEEIKAYYKELKEKSIPKRTEEEKRMYRENLLREKSEDGSYCPISIEEAYERLGKEAISFFKHGGWINQAEDLAQELLLRLSPFVAGQRGDFQNFDHFERYFYSAAKNLMIDAYRRRELRDKTITNYAREQEAGVIFSANGKTYSESIAVVSNVPLRASEIRLIALYAQYGGNWKAIVSVLGLTSSAVCAMKSRYMRVLNKINPERKKGNRGKSSLKINEGQLIEEYNSLRAETLRTKGKIPSSVDIISARRQGKLSCAPVTLYIHFGGKWSKAQSRLEELIKETDKVVQS